MITSRVRLLTGIFVVGASLPLLAQPNASSRQGAANEASAHAVASSDRQTQQLMSRLFALSADSMEGRRAGTPGGARARRWIERELRSIGLQSPGAVTEQRVPLTARAGSDTVGANIIARIPGRDSTAPVIVLSAHYDHLGIRNGAVFNGADDDASGCVALLALVERVLKLPLLHDVIVVFFDAEESGLVGAKEFVRAPPVPLPRVAININLDMVSRVDSGGLWVAGTARNPFLLEVVGPLAKAARVPVHFGHDTKDLKPGDDWTGSSDHGAFVQRGIPFLYLGVEDHPDYHKASDKASRVDPAAYSAVVDFAEQLLRSVDASISRFPARQ